LIIGWHFESGDNHYYVGASDAKSAQTLLAKKDEAASQVHPRRIADGVVTFFNLKEGTIISGRIIERGRS